MSTPFTASGATVNLTAGTSTLSLALNTLISWGGAVRLCNTGTEDVFFAFGDSNVTVTLTNGVPLLGRSAEVFSVGSATHVAMITAASTAKVYVTPGGGI